MDIATGQSRRAAIVAGFQQQVAWCQSLGSPFTATLLSRLTADIEAGGQTAALIGEWPGDPTADALPLRMAGALHALALDGSQPDLSAVYPPYQTTSDALWRVVSAVLAERAAFLRAFLASPPQTNEVGRSGVLLGGFLCIAQATGLPLRTLEIGASAGLNLWWDRYRYTLGTGHWGDPDSPVRLEPKWEGPLPPLSQPLTVLRRDACDIAPIDLSDAAQRLRLQAYVWPDQRDRLDRLVGAIAVARDAGSVVAKADAAAWLKGHLATVQEGAATVLYHSIMWQYLPEATRTGIAGLMAAAGARATPQAPLAWLRFEPPPATGKPELRLTLWPAPTDQRLATAHPHGAAITWL